MKEARTSRALVKIVREIPRNTCSTGRAAINMLCRTGSDGSFRDSDMITWVYMLQSTELEAILLSFNMNCFQPLLSVTFSAVFPFLQLRRVSFAGVQVFGGLLRIRHLGSSRNTLRERERIEWPKRGNLSLPRPNLLANLDFLILHV